MKLRRVGNTLIVTIPKRVAEAMGWNEGDEVQVRGSSLSDGMEKPRG
jgi:AbrB family looped-hinge helix DNA binding protein